MTSWAFEMEVIILGWYVLVETGSVVALTVFGALQQGGTLIAPMMGVVSDRIGPRNCSPRMRAIYAAIATTLMTLAFAGSLNPVIVLVLVGLMGLVRPSDLGLRAALDRRHHAAEHADRRDGIQPRHVRLPRASPARSPAPGWSRSSAWDQPTS